MDKQHVAQSRHGCFSSKLRNQRKVHVYLRSFAATIDEGVAHTIPALGHLQGSPVCALLWVGAEAGLALALEASLFEPCSDLLC